MTQSVWNIVGLYSKNIIGIKSVKNTRYMKMSGIDTNYLWFDLLMLLSCLFQYKYACKVVLKQAAIWNNFGTVFLLNIVYLCSMQMISFMAVWFKNGFLREIFPENKENLILLFTKKMVCYKKYPRKICSLNVHQHKIMISKRVKFQCEHNLQQKS